MNDYHNVIAISREYADVTSKSLLQVRHIDPLSSMKNKTVIQIKKVRFFKKHHSF